MDEKRRLNRVRWVNNASEQEAGSTGNSPAPLPGFAGAQQAQPEQFASGNLPANRGMFPAENRQAFSSPDPATGNSVQPAFPQAGSPQPGPARPGFSPSGFIRPGFSLPTFAQPGFPQPDRSQGGYAQPGYSQAGYSQPDRSQAGYSQPGFPQPEPFQPGPSQVGYSQPGFAQSAYSQPGFPYPAFAQPGSAGNAEGMMDQALPEQNLDEADMYYSEDMYEGAFEGEEGLYAEEEQPVEEERHPLRDALFILVALYIICCIAPLFVGLFAPLRVFFWLEVAGWIIILGWLIFGVRAPFLAWLKERKKGRREHTESLVKEFAEEF